MSRKLFCEFRPVTYKISVRKGIILRYISDLFKAEKYARKKADSDYDNTIKSHSSFILRKLEGVDIIIHLTRIDRSCPKTAASVNALIEEIKS